MVQILGREPPPPDASRPLPVTRVQLGVRIEQRLVKVLNGLAEFEDVTLGQLLEKIVLHSFTPVPGHEGEMAASPHGRKALAAITDLQRTYRMTYNLHGFRAFQDSIDDPSQRGSSSQRLR